LTLLQRLHQRLVDRRFARLGKLAFQARLGQRQLVQGALAACYALGQVL
jgi:hypothetical protein